MPTAQPSGPPSHDVTAMDWNDVTRFATDVGDLLASLQAISTQMNTTGTFTIMPGVFAEAVTLKSDTAMLGASLQSDYTWMTKLLGDIQTGLTNAVASLSKTDTLQKENGQTLLNDLSAMNADLSTGPAAKSGA